jgi:flagellar basal-body rod protein FlgB
MPSIFDLVDQLERTMTFHRERHSVLAGNVANLDTPGFVPMDLVAVENDPAAKGGEGGIETEMVQSSAERGPDGNAVSLEHELAKIDANRVRYTASAELVSRRLALLRYAASDGTT